jgi:hypothetical protein
MNHDETPFPDPPGVEQRTGRFGDEWQMVAHGSPTSPPIRHVMHDGRETRQSWILNSGKDARPSAFLVEQSAECVIRPHFHDTSQFQVAVGGRARLNGHPWLPYSVHYTRRQTSYGPIIAEEGGFSYLTLRPARDTGPAWIPEDLARAERTAIRRQVTTPPLVPAEMEAGKAVLIERDDEGLAAYVLRIAPGARQRIEDDPLSGGRYLIVLEGSARAPDGTTLDRIGTIWADPQDTGLEVEAGKDGLHLLVLQFPAYVVAETERRLGAARA